MFEPKCQLNSKAIVQQMPASGGGGSSQDYSTEDVLIGKWIDGETDVYEKVITGISLSINASDWAVYSGITDVGNLISLDAYYTTTYGLLHCLVAEYQASPAGGVKIYGVTGYERTADTLIIRYIKKLS